MTFTLTEIILIVILLVIAWDCIKQIINSITMNRFMKNLNNLRPEEREKIINALSKYLTKRQR